MNPVSARILAGLVLGLGAGALLSALHSPALPGVLAVAGPIGKAWLAALTMTVVPLVFSLLVNGVAATARTGGADRTARRALIGFAIGLLAVSVVAALYAVAVLRLWPPLPDAAPISTAPPPAPPQGDWLAGFIPSNPIKAAAETAMAPLVVFALLFGFAATRIDETLRATLTRFFEAVAQTMLVIVRWVLWIGPLGVAALAIGVGATLGAGAFGSLLHYGLIVSGACVLAGLLAWGAAVVAGGVSPGRFARVAAPAQAVAISTQSSLASLPAMIEAAPALGASGASAAVTLPLAVAVFRAASAAANVAVVIWLAAFHGLALTPALVATVAVVAPVMSIGAVGLPAQVSFFAMLAPVCLAAGVPLEMLPLLLAVESVPDIFRTVGNVTADLAAARLVGGRERPETAA